MSANDPWQFSSSPLGPGDSRVLAFSGEEAVGEGYSFDILLLASKTGPKEARDLQEALMRAPMITLRGKGADNSAFVWNGMAQEIFYAFPTEAGAVYRVLLRPRSWKLSISTHSRIFLNLSLMRLLGKLLTEEKMTAGKDFVKELKADYKSRPFTCQYNESSWDFLSRQLERVGAYTFIRQTDSGDVLVLADGHHTPEDLPQRPDLDWSRDKSRETVYSFVRALSAGPDSVLLRDYCSEHPGVTEGKAADVEGKLWGKGEFAAYGGFDLFGEVDCFARDFAHEDAHAAAGKLAAARHAALVCAASLARGQSTVPHLRAGYVFTLDGEKYQLLRVRHHFFMPRDAQETGIADRARQEGVYSGNADAGYRNEFVCRPLAHGPYAPPVRTPRPVIAGTVNAVIDAAGSGKYAELDKKGRYRVKFHFAEKVFHSDSDSPSDGNNSVPLRMMQAHTGGDSGIHFPLQKGVEVLISFIQGDPDRPVILGTLPNASTPGPVVDDNHQENVIRTPGGNTLTMVDSEGKKEVRLQLGSGKSSITMRE
jgi:type VI secretion system secreted protein VgrG